MSFLLCSAQMSCKLYCLESCLIIAKVCQKWPPESMLCFHKQLLCFFSLLPCTQPWIDSCFPYCWCFCFGFLCSLLSLSLAVFICLSFVGQWKVNSSKGRLKLWDSWEFCAELPNNYLAGTQWRWVDETERERWREREKESVSVRNKKLANNALCCCLLPHFVRPVVISRHMAGLIKFMSLQRRSHAHTRTHTCVYIQITLTFADRQTLAAG